jgi:membrane-bound lytic murein transglycosylase F
LFLIQWGQYIASRHTDATTAFGRMTSSGDYHLLSWDMQAQAGNWEISRYDALLREVGEQEGHDWRLLSAIAYKESRFEADVVSRRGAIGLMQIMPAVARSYNVEGQMVADPRTNVTLAAKVLTAIERSLRFSRSTPREDRMRIVLAGYNSGVGHVLDARKLAAKYGADPNSWEDVSAYLSLKSDPAYASDEVVSCGSFNGSSETLAFVDGVMGKYKIYCNRVRQ